MGDLYSGWQSPKISSAKITSRSVVISMMIVLTVLTTLSFSMYGRGLGDPNCQCTTTSQSSWNLGSAILVLIFIVGIMVLLWRPELLVQSS